MFPTKWSTLTGVLFLFGTIKAFLVPWVHEAVPYYDDNYYNEHSITNEMTNEESKTKENSGMPIITVVKKPKPTQSGQHPNIFWRTQRNKNDPVLVFSTLLNHQ